MTDHLAEALASLRARQARDAAAHPGRRYGLPIVTELPPVDLPVGVEVERRQLDQETTADEATPAP